MPQTALIGAFLAGLLGGLHCVAMCGGWLTVVAHAPATPAAVPLQPARVLMLGEFAAHAGRITLYALLGHEPRPPAAFFGHPLFRKDGAPAPLRSADPQVVASSYGSV